MARTIEIDQVELMQQMTLVVKMTRTREMRIRLWIATRLIILAAWVTGMGIEFEDTEEEQDAKN
jgi:hypothetical protein